MSTNVIMPAINDVLTKADSSCFFHIAEIASNMAMAEGIMTRIITPNVVIAGLL